MQDFIEETEINNKEDSNNLDSLNDKDYVSKRVLEIQDSINKLNIELQELIMRCNHSDGYSIKLLTDKNKSQNSLRKVCRICNSPIGYPSQAEINDWKQN